MGRRRYRKVDDGYGSDSLTMESPRRPKRGLFEEGSAPRRSFSQLLQELRSHFCSTYRLTELRRSLWRKMHSDGCGIGDMFALVDKDGSLSLAATELQMMAVELGLDLRFADAVSLIDEIGGGSDELTIERFAVWFNDEPAEKTKPDHVLLSLDSALFDPEVRDVVAAFWRLADADGSGTLQREEYFDLSCNLQRALNTDAEDVVKIAERDWDEDRRGFDSVDKRRFELSLLQLAEAWGDDDLSQCPPRIVALSVARTLSRLLDQVSVVDDTGLRIWRWNVSEDHEVQIDDDSLSSSEASVESSKYDDILKAADATKDSRRLLWELDDDSDSDFSLSDVSDQHDDQPAPLEKTQDDTFAEDEPASFEATEESPQSDASSPVQQEHPEEEAEEEEEEIQKDEEPPVPELSLHDRELLEMESLVPRRSVKSSEETDVHSYATSLESSPREPLPRLVPKPSPSEPGETSMLLEGAEFEFRPLSPVTCEDLEVPESQQRIPIVFHRDLRDFETNTMLVSQSDTALFRRSPKLRQSSLAASCRRRPPLPLDDVLATNTCLLPASTLQTKRRNPLLLPQLRSLRRVASDFPPRTTTDSYNT